MSEVCLCCVCFIVTKLGSIHLAKSLNILLLSVFLLLSTPLSLFLSPLSFLFLFPIHSLSLSLIHFLTHSLSRIQIGVSDIQWNEMCLFFSVFLMFVCVSVCCD